MKISSRQGYFKPIRVDYSASSGGIIGIIFRFSLILRHVVCSHENRRDDYTQHAIINMKRKITLNYPEYNNVCSHGIFFPKNEFEIAVVNEPSVFELLLRNCNSALQYGNAAKRYDGMTNNKDSDQTVSYILWVCSVCTDLSIPIL